MPRLTIVIRFFYYQNGFYVFSKKFTSSYKNLQVSQTFLLVIYEKILF